MTVTKNGIDWLMVIWKKTEATDLSHLHLCTLWRSLLEVWVNLKKVMDQNLSLYFSSQKFSWLWPKMDWLINGHLKKTKATDLSRLRFCTTWRNLLEVWLNIKKLWTKTYRNIFLLKNSHGCDQKWIDLLINGHLKKAKAKDLSLLCFCALWRNSLEVWVNI